MRCVMALAFCTLTACAADRYRYALTHAYITPWTHLAQADIEQIIWVVSHATSQPVVGVSQSGSDPTLVRVITAVPSEDIPDHCTGFHLRKLNGHWQIVFHGSSSDTNAQIILSNRL